MDIDDESKLAPIYCPRCNLYLIRHETKAIGEDPKIQSRGAISVIKDRGSNPSRLIRRYLPLGHEIN
jgi:hypothetical protein